MSSKKFHPSLGGILAITLILVSLLFTFSLAQTPEFIWTKMAGGARGDRGYAICADNSGNCFVTGYFYYTVNFGPFTLQSSGGRDIFVAKYTASGSVLWAIKIGGTSEDRGNAIATDGTGHILVTGSFSGTVIFGAGETNETSLISDGGEDIFIAKYKPDGMLLWAKKAGGPSGNYGYAIATDGAGNSIITGNFLGTVTFGPGETNETSLTSVGSEDIFIAKYDTNGVLLWAKKAGGTNPDYGQGISIDGAGNILVTGNFASTATFGGGEPNETQLVGNGGYDLFVAKYAPSGVLLWVKRAGGSNLENGNGIATDGAGNILVTGNFDDTATFGAGEAYETQLTSTGYRDIFIAKYDPNGALLWAKKAGGSSKDFGYAISTDETGNSLIAGTFSETAIFGAGEANETQLTSAGHFDIFVAKYDTAGALLWAEQAGGPSNDYAYGIANNSSHYIFLTGFFENSATFGTLTLTSNGGQDFFVAKLSEYHKAVTLTIPDTIGYNGQNLDIAIYVSTDSSISIAQFVVEYDSTVIQYQSAQVGPDINGFNIRDNAALPFNPLTPGTNDNVLIQIYGGGQSVFSGDHLKAVILNFNIVGANGDSTVLAFDSDETHTFLTTASLYDISGTDIDFSAGKIKIPEFLDVVGHVYFDNTATPLPGVEITLNDSTLVLTDEDGYYVFQGVVHGTCHLSLTKEGDLQEAISGSDALLILKSLAFLESLTPGQKIAADVTLDGKITGADAVALLRYLAFFSTEIAHTGKWRFFPADTTFDMTENTTIDANGYLLGDVNLSWGSGGLLAKTTEQANVSHALKNVSLQIGELRTLENNNICLPISIDTKENEINTLLLSFEYDADVFEYKTTLAKGLPENYLIVENGTEKGKLHLAMAGLKGIVGKVDLLELEFSSMSDQAGSAKLAMTRAVVNDIGIEALPQQSLSLVASQTPQTYKLFQNYPNPFNNETTIRYQLPRTSKVTITIFNSLGQQIKQLAKKQQQPGNYSITWDSKDDYGKEVGSGIYFCHFRAGNYFSNKKLIILK